jgi:UDP-N-acetylglucosamine--dolichyl-phosphate N-acetylglucosaminephosphotransferase
MQFNYPEILYPILSFLISLGITYAILPSLIKYLQKKGITGIDIHKPTKPEIPEMGGIAILIGLISTQIFLIFLLSEYTFEFLAFISVILLTGCVGIYDDLKGLGPKKKPLLLTLLSMLIVFPLLLFGVVTPRPLLPIIGRTRLTIIYWIALLVAIAVPANAVNMLDVFNGSMPITCMIVSMALLICAIILDSPIGIIFSLSLLGTLIAFFKFNKFPSKVFSGNVGSLTVGASIGLIEVIGRLEIAAIIALMPHIMNAFHILTSMGGLKEGKTLPNRPILILPNGKLAANPDKDAPLTLTRLVLARGALTEVEIVKIFGILSIFCAILAIISVGITPR